MTDTDLRHSASREAQSTAPVRSDAQTLVQSLLTTLRNMDFEYERECERITSSTPNANLATRALDRLREYHLERREPYVRQVAILQQRTLSR